MKGYGSNKVQLYDKPNLLEREKRQCYIDIAAKQKIPFLLILDSDEYIECPKPLSLLKELKSIERQWLDSNVGTSHTKPLVGNVVNIEFIETDPLTGSAISVTYRPRLWYRPEDMYYTTKHYYFKSKKSKIQTGSYAEGSEFRTLALSSNLKIWHDQHSCRPEERQQQSRYYEIESLPTLE